MVELEALGERRRAGAPEGRESDSLALADALGDASKALASANGACARARRQPAERSDGEGDGACVAGMAKPVRPLVPPDGGWGWMVVLGVAVCNATTQSLLSVFGLLFFDTLEEMGAETTGAAVISNSMVAITNFSGLMTGPVMRRFTYRQVAMAGGVLVAVGMFFTSMATKMWHLFVSYSVLVGLGLGLLNPSTFVAVNAFFTRARGRAVGLSMAGTGLGQMLMPHAVRFLLDRYSFRGAVLILSAVALHSIAGAMLFHPLRWHARPAPADDSDSAPAPASCPERQPLAKHHHHRRHPQQAHHARQPTKAAATAVAVPRRGDVEAPAAERRPLTGPAHAHAHDKGARPPTPLRDVAAMGDSLPVVRALDMDKAEKEFIVLEEKRRAGCWGRWVRLLDLDLLSDAFMVMLLAGLAAVYTAGVNFNMLYPFFLAASGLARADVALCMSLMAGLDITSRLVLPLFTDRARVPARITFLVGALVLAATRSLVALQEELPALLATSALCGFVRGATTVNHNLAVSESCSPEKLPGALGLNMVIKGISILILGLFIGWLRDVTGSYTLCMHVLSLIVTLPMLVWLAEIWVSRRRRRRLHRPSVSPPPSPLPSRQSPPPYEAPPSPPRTPTPPTPPPTPSPPPSPPPPLLSPSSPLTAPKTMPTPRLQVITVER
ncbi:hypothetical protein R5R35_014750 [Gryllus longicercus]|uniref:Monocarboxylate transporter n=1 Tax=Gryllus longicercus TaxID=2509291 RepID=A0AAN9YT45_9ORTH